MNPRLLRVFALDVRALALFRIGLAVCLLLDCATRAIDVRPFLTDSGLYPRALWFKLAGPEQWSFHVATGSTPGALFLLAVAAVLAVALLVGWRARAAAVGSLILLVSLHNRNGQVFYGFDLMLRVSLLWACFLPLAERWSLSAARSGANSSPSTPTAVLSPATVALTLQMVVLYVCSGIQKLQDDSWHSLDAVWFGLTTDHHATSIARWLAAPSLYEVTRALSLLVLVLELAVPLLLFVPSRRARLVVVAAFALFHVGTAALFHLGLFPLVGIVAWLPFLPQSKEVARTNDVRVDGRRSTAALVGALFVVVLAANIESVSERRFMPRALQQVVNIARLEQNWNMFERVMSDGWFIARATRHDGSTIDLLKKGAPVTLEKPDDVAGTFSSMRWRKYVTGLVRSSGVKHRRPFLQSLCREWTRSTGERLRTVELLLMQEVESPKPDVPSTTTMRNLASVRCR